MKTLIELTLGFQAILMIYFIYIIKACHWANGLYSVRQTLHMLLSLVLVANVIAWNLNPVVLVLYIGVTLEEFLNMRFFVQAADKFWSHGEGEASLSVSDRHFLGRYIDGLKVDLSVLARMTVNIFTTGLPMKKSESDQIFCSEMAKQMSVPEILLHPSNFGHETVRMMLLALLLFL